MPYFWDEARLMACKTCLFTGIKGMHCRVKDHALLGEGVPRWDKSCLLVGHALSGLRHKASLFIGIRLIEKRHASLG